MSGRSKTKGKPKKRQASSGKSAPARPERAAKEARGDKVLETVLTEVTAQPETQRLDEWVTVPCPYCGEDFEVHVTSESEGQTLYEDCQVCCRPVSLHVHAEEGELQVEAHRS